MGPIAFEPLGGGLHSGPGAVFRKPSFGIGSGGEETWQVAIPELPEERTRVEIDENQLRQKLPSDLELSESSAFDSSVASGQQEGTGDNGRKSSGNGKKYKISTEFNLILMDFNGFSWVLYGF